MTEADLETVLGIEYLSFATPWPRDIFLGELRGSDMAHLFVARISEGDEQGRVVGYSCTWVVTDEMHITSFAVHPHYRRQHVGHQLLAGVLTRAVELGCRQAVLEVRASNLGAQRLYAHFGFAPVAVRKRYYADNHEDAIVMFLDDIAAQMRRHDLTEGASDGGS
ncbi:MAG TPA: ribosomal protein S18-alanine N-acetyltransferase [Candidatus Tectomicrobia bacterium]|nr:ribosomal protein S18-alanine N-acetyltransferase [Candidatus Tectomicrobia bacterium]